MTLISENKFELPNGEILTNIHPKMLCKGRNCVIHNPSNHHMKDWPLNWRQFDGWINIKPSHFERICPHGIGHPDPDDLAFHGDSISVHGCDGCCNPNLNSENNV